MTLRLAISPKACDDMRAIWTTMAARDFDAADRVHDALGRVFNHLTEFPGLGRLRPEHGADIRAFALRAYP